MLAERWLQTGLLQSYPLVAAWADALLADERVIGSVPDNFRQEFVANLERGGTFVAGLIAANG